MKGTEMIKKSGLVLVLLLLLVTFTSAKRGSKKPRLLPLTSIHIVDRNGFSETISNKDRLEQFLNVDFLASQPYQKVLRIYARDSKGNVRSVLTSYHANGNPKQFLEILNGRAYGNYREWHENGQISLSTVVIGGNPDITPLAEKTWLFDGSSYAWDEEGHILAEIQYSQGALEGISTYYHPSGAVWKRIPYHKNQTDGVLELYKDCGGLLQQITYSQGIKQGTALRYWDSNQIASQEEYIQGHLESGSYFDKNGKLISEVCQGTGYRTIFGKDYVHELQEYRQGILEGEVKVFNPQARLKRIYHVQNGIKHGEEIEYYENPLIPIDQPQPKLSFYWYEGKIQGLSKTWYPNGNLESQKEMANNDKSGVSTIWYRDGNLMMIEEYDQNKLVRGDYFKRGEKTPISQIIQGKGTLILYDADGHFVQKVNYTNGKPEL